MTFISNHYHAIFTAFITLSVVTLAVYYTSKHYNQQDNQNPQQTTRTQEPQRQSQHPRTDETASAPPCAATPNNKSAATADAMTELAEPSQTAEGHSPKTNPVSTPSDIPSEIDYTPVNGSMRNSYRSVLSRPRTRSGGNSAFTPFDSDSPNTKPIKIWREQTTTITFPNEEPIVIKQTTTERIDIPTSDRIDIPTTKLLWSPFVQGLRFALVQNQGKRAHMENSARMIDMKRMKAARHYDELSTHLYSFSLFDGHVGAEAADFCTQHLHEYVEQLMGSQQRSSALIKDCIHKAFLMTDQRWKEYALSAHKEDGAVGVYVLYDADARHPENDCIYVANVGDCKAVLCSDGQPLVLTEEHNPKNADEQKRCGDLIDASSDLLSGQISVTRAIGDFYKVGENEVNRDVYRHKKLDGLICEPHILEHKLGLKDEFLILACDGLWDVVDDKSATATCRRSLRANGDVDLAAHKLVDLAKAQSNIRKLDAPAGAAEEELTSDNISVMVIGFAQKDASGKEHIGPKRPTLLRGGRSRRFGRFKRSTGNVEA